MQCPNCSREIIVAKYKIVNCKCGRTLMLAEINKVKQLIDVTPNKEDEVNGRLQTCRR